MKKRWLWIPIVASLLLGAWSFWSLGAKVRIDVVRPKVQTICAYVEEQAVTELPQDHLISMPIAGWLQRIELREGDAVKQNQVVARLETDDLSDRVKQSNQRIAVLETKVKETQDNRLEGHMLVEAQAVVKAIDETVQAAEVQLEGSLAIFDFAKSEVERLKKLAESDAVAERELSEAKKEMRKSGADYRSDVLELAALKTLAAVSYIGPKFITDYIDRKSFQVETYRRQIDETNAELEIEKRNLSRAEILSPIDGVVLQRHQTRRQFLPAGTPLLTVGKLDDMEIVAEVLTERATSILPGATVEVFGKAIPDGPLEGKVLRVYPAGFKKISSLGVEQQRVNVAIGLSRRPPRLGVGYRVHVRIIYDQADDVLTLPRTCIFRGTKSEWQVMIVRNKRIEIRQVEIGLMNDELVHIKGGISKDDLVAIRPSREIEAGMRVEAIEVPDEEKEKGDILEWHEANVLQCPCAYDTIASVC